MFSKEARFFVSIILTLFCYYYIPKPAYDKEVYIWSLFSLTLIINLTLKLIVNRNNKDLLFLPALIITWLYFAFPYLSIEKIDHMYRIIPDSELYNMSFYSNLSIISLYLGYNLIKLNIKPIFNQDTNISNNLLNKILFVIILIDVINSLLKYYLPSITTSLGAILAILEYLPTTIGAIAYLLFKREKKFNLIIVISIVYCIFLFFVYVANTLFISILLLGLGPLLIELLVFNKIPLKYMLIISLFIYPVFITRHIFREEALKWWYEGEDISKYQLYKKGLNIYFNLDNTLGQLEEKESNEKTKSRMEQVSYLGQCVYQHEIIGWNYLYGETFWWLPIAPIPRIIIPFKPKNIMASKMAEEYGLKGKGHGAMNWPLLCDYYVNFGYFGMVFLSFFQGMAYYFFYKKFDFGKGDLNLLGILSISIILIKIEANITLVFGQLIQFYIIWSLIKLYLKKYSSIKV